MICYYGHLVEPRADGFDTQIPEKINWYVEGWRMIRVYLNINEAIDDVEQRISRDEYIAVVQRAQKLLDTLNDCKPGDMLPGSHCSELQNRIDPLLNLECV